MRGTTTIPGFIACLVCLLAIAPRLAAALELGPIEARSALYEPLDARIGIDGVRIGDLDELKVVLGSPAQFELAGVARLQYLELLEFTLVKQNDGGGYIRVWTAEPIIEPSLTFLVDVEWPRGRVVRGYKLHLSAAAGTAGASSSRRTVGQPEPEPEPVSGASTVPAAAPPAGSTYGPVRSPDTLWSIARRFRPDESISIQRMMLVILEANPQAFAFRNVNALNAGAVLRIPTLDEIGSDDVGAAIAEVNRQHAAWKEHQEGGRSAAASATSDSTPAATGRIEIVSPETAPSDAGIAEDADASALHERLALALEEVDTERRQADELKLRLVEAEDRIRKLGRLIDLQNEEVAALRAQLQAFAAAPPASSETDSMPSPAPSETDSMPTPAPSETDSMPTPAPSEMDSMPTPAPSETDSMPTPAPSETDSMPTPAPSEMDSMPTPAPSEMEPMPTPAPSETDSMPTPAPSETTPAAAEPATMPFGLGALPINPVFLVGGAGLLLILLGIVALLRRRRASSEEDDLAAPIGMAAAAAADSASADDDGLLHELEAVAADLADDTDAPRHRGAQTAQAVDSPDDADPGAGEGAVLRLDPDSPADERAEDTEAERALLGTIDEDDDADVSFDIDALTDDDLDDSGEPTALDPDSDSDSDEDARSDEAVDELDAPTPKRDEGAGALLDMDDLSDLAALVPERESETAESFDGMDDDLDALFGEWDVRTSGPDSPASAPMSGADDPPVPPAGALEGEASEATPAPPTGGGESPASDIGTAGVVALGADDLDSASAVTASSGSGLDPDDAGKSDLEPGSLFDETTDDGDIGALSLDDIGEDEMQTKLDLAQVYMEMGDTDSARGFLEAVLADGDTDQRDIARDMLSRLT